jgi:cytosine/adenosine deaminase-related metal-dependent hydrolase
MDLIAARGATIVINTSSNFIVSSGLAPLGEMLERGCRVAMGLDGLAFDEDEDALREMRLTYAVHKARGFDIRLPHADLLRLAFEHGRYVITGSTDGGRVAPGAPADLLLLDWDALAAELIEPNVPPLHLLLAKATHRHVKSLFVGGREIVRDGTLITIDLSALEAELLAALRRAAPTTGDIRAAMPKLGAALAAHYGNVFYCG